MASCCGQRVKATVSGVTTSHVGDLYEKRTNGVTKKYYFAGGLRVAMRKSGVLHFLLTDHLGSTSVSVDSNGDRVAELRYYPFGGTRYEGGRDAGAALPLHGPAHRDGHGAV